ncbi:MAG: hypothetical protein RPR28_07715 [Cycloclasticus sp.]
MSEENEDLAADKSFDDGFDAAFSEDAAPEQNTSTVADESADAAHETTTREPQDDDKPAAEDEPDKLADLQSQLDAANHTARSSQGRELSNKRQLEKMQEENQRLQAQLDKTDTEDDDDTDEDDDDVQDLMNDFPGMEKYINQQVNDKTAPLKEKLDQYQQADDEADAQYAVEQENARNAQDFAVVDQVREQHADFDDILKDPEYGAWYWAQPASVQAQADSGDAMQMAGLINQFKKSRIKKSDKRAKGLEAMAGVGGRRGGNKLQSKPETDPFDAAFENAFKDDS